VLAHNYVQLSLARISSCSGYSKLFEPACLGVVLRAHIANILLLGRWSQRSVTSVALSPES
ncbi:hypothetical protein Ac2012v2_007997, partial [Leucoagaricus gongylophorus]